jgi:colicin import membrane protein
MKRAWMLSLVLAAGCSSAPETDPDAKAPAPPTPAPAPPSPKEAQLNAARSQLAVKKNELTQANADLERLAAERAQLDAAGASEEKTRRLAEIASLETESKRKKQALALDIADLEAQLRDLTAGGKSSDDPLAAALEEDAAAEREKAERRKAKEEADRSAEASKLAQAEAARKAEVEAKSKEKVDSAPAAGEGQAFEERFAAVILKVREALQQFKRW